MFDQDSIKTDKAITGTVEAMTTSTRRCPMTHQAQQKAAAAFWKSYFAKFSSDRRAPALEPDTLPAPLAFEDRRARASTPPSVATPTSAHNAR